MPNNWDKKKKDDLNIKIYFINYNDIVTRALVIGVIGRNTKKKLGSYVLSRCGGLAIKL